MANDLPLGAIVFAEDGKLIYVEPRVLEFFDGRYRWFISVRVGFSLC